ncbi:hypothetical protein BDV98DRAFT_623655 [Pterulicium gracile]|uniref:F-box domain-containing protein n=1 Tax=Pterulicium gracile TaxID=1884261 RepID=A0A5C3QEY6_9AGAR|nr:hypothetical protein BDV98DRAFT_623655 [Pterula gracilis]
MKHIAETKAHIAQTMAHLRALERMRNNYRMTANLPPEVLGLILTEASRSQGPYVVVSWKRHIQLASICRRWWTVAPETQSFWAAIPISRSMHFEDMLASPKQLEPMWECFPRSPTHYLLSLRIRRRRLQEDDPDDFNDLISVPKHVLTSPEPQLQHLELISCQLPWDALARTTGDGETTLRNLITLQLHQVVPPPPAALLVDLLSSSHHLENVELSDCIPDGLDTFTTETHGQSLTQLDHLEELILEGGICQTIHLARCVNVPARSREFTLQRVRVESMNKLNFDIRVDEPEDYAPAA